MRDLQNALTSCWAGDSADGMAGLTVFDLIILTALAAGLVTGALRGFVQEVLSLAALLVALFALRVAHTPLTEMLVAKTDNTGTAAIIAFLLIMAVVWGGGRYVAMRAGASTRKSMIGPIDRLLGAGFGTLKALMIAATLFMLTMLAYDVVYGPRSDRPDWLAQSRTYPLIRATAAALSEVVAERLAAEPDSAPAPATER